MASQNLTIFQRLGKVLGPDGIKQKQLQPTQRYNLNGGELLKTTSKAEYNQAKLQAQQNKYLKSTWKKVENGLFQQSINYETTRIGSYADFEAMEFYPTIGAALDVISEESTTLNNDGKMLNVYSNSSRIKGVLEDLFYNRLDLHTSLPMFIRNMVKYGDNFVLLNIDSKSGVLGCKQMPNYEMERRESDLFDIISNRDTVNGGNEFGPSKVKFFWRGQGRDAEFNSWQIAHFRLLGDDRRLPYGTSILEKSRRVWKQLIVSEDSMLTYRVTRAPERRVFKVYVGNIDDADIESYVDSVANKFKRTPVIDPQTGQIDLRFNQLPVWKNTPIPLLDGRTLTIEELAKEYDEGKENWVYSIQDTTHQIVGGKVKWCGKNYTADKMVRVWLDDDKYVVTAEEHPFILRDGSKKRADELKENDSLMPFYTKLSTKEDGMRIEGYPMVYNPKSSRYNFTHRIIGETYLLEDKKRMLKETDWKVNNNLTIHHKDFTKINANPNNLKWIGNVDHINYHKKRGGEILTKYNKSEKKRLRNIELAKEQNWGDRFIGYNNSELHTEHNKIRKEAQIKYWSNPVKKELRSKAMQINFDETIWNDIRKNIIGGTIKNRKTLIEFLNQKDIIDYILSINKNERFTKQRKIDRTVIERQLVNKGFSTITEYINESKKNHKVRLIEFISGDDVYCMTVIGQNGEDDRHNFATLSFEKNGSISESGVFVGNSNDQDIFVPTRTEDAANPIDTLPGATNLDQIADIEFLRSNLFTALRVPKPFLGFDDAAGEGKNLALQDIRFSRTINKVQLSILQELNKIAIIHLYLLGFEDDIDNFSLTLNNPSTQAEMLKVEHIQAKVTLFKDAVSDAGNGFGVMSMTRGHREIMGWSDDEIKQDLLEQRMEKAAAAELANTSSIIKHTGMFDVVDRIYGDFKAALKGGTPQGDGEGAGGGSGGGGGLGGSFGGGGLGGEDIDFGDTTDEENEMGEDGMEDDSESTSETETTETETNSESVNEALLILENKRKKLKKKLDDRKLKYSNKFVDVLIESIDGKGNIEKVEKVKVYNQGIKINKNIDNIIDNIDDMLKE